MELTGFKLSEIWSHETSIEMEIKLSKVTRLSETFVVVYSVDWVV